MTLSACTTQNVLASQNHRSGGTTATTLISASSPHSGSAGGGATAGASEPNERHLPQLKILKEKLTPAGESYHKITAPALDVCTYIQKEKKKVTAKSVIYQTFESSDKINLQPHTAHFIHITSYYY